MYPIRVVDKISIHVFPCEYMASVKQFICAIFPAPGEENARSFLRNSDPCHIRHIRAGRRSQFHGIRRMGHEAAM